MGDQIPMPIIEILSNAHDKDLTNIQPTLLYNEGWMLRLVLDWLSHSKNHEIKCEVLDIEEKAIELSIPDDCKWFSEALLPSPFLRGKAGREGYTHADGVVGKFCIGEDKKKKGKLSLNPGCDFFYVVEAKMFSPLSSGTINAKGYNQAARSIACIAELLLQKDLTEQKFEKLGFYVWLPKEHPDLKINSNNKLKDILDRENIKTAIIKRMNEFDKESASWLRENIDSFVGKIDIRAITWDNIVKFIEEKDPEFGLGDFYENCRKFNEI